ncbi:MAG: hypothetical protein L3K08_09010 [Thermoplasmata archaeon]|nr:hypothetical protein [Thermoplasmata archaeon]
MISMEERFLIRSSASLTNASAVCRFFLSSSAFSCRMRVSREDDWLPSPPLPVVAYASP